MLWFELNSLLTNKARRCIIFLRTFMSWNVAVCESVVRFKKILIFFSQIARNNLHECLGIFYILGVNFWKDAVFLSVLFTLYSRDLSTCRHKQIYLGNSDILRDQLFGHNSLESRNSDRVSTDFKGFNARIRHVAFLKSEGVELQFTISFNKNFLLVKVTAFSRAPTPLTSSASR